MKRILIVFLACVLPGCAGDYLARGLPMLEGEPLSLAIRHLGYPMEEKKILGKTMYSWTSYQSGIFFVPPGAPHPVVVRDHGHPGVAFPDYGAPQIEEFYSWSCRLDIVADKGLIVHTQYHGTGGGCRVFSEQLKPLVKEKEKREEIRPDKAPS